MSHPPSSLDPHGIVWRRIELTLDVGRQYGFGRHTLAIGISNAVICAKVSLPAVSCPHPTLRADSCVPGQLMYAFELCFTVMATVIKLALLLLYRRMFPTRRFKIALYPIAGITLVAGVAIVLAIAFQCHPINLAWDKTVPGSCGDTKSLLIATVAVNMVTDLIVLATPIPVVWALQMSKMQKVGVTIAFGTGILFVPLDERSLESRSRMLTNAIQGMYRGRCPNRRRRGHSRN